MNKKQKFSKEKEKMEKKSKNLETEISNEDSEQTSQTKENTKVEANQIEKELESVQTELGDLKDKLLRTAAEYDNFRKRTEKEKALIYTNATADAVEALLPIVDSVEFAINSSKDASESYRKGLELMSSQIKTSFEKLGITESAKVGDKFNPEFHNAVSHIEDDSEKENTIVEIFQKGYMIKDRVIRYAMVKVAN